MSKIPLPERGQPLDVSYIYQLANAINEIAVQFSPSVGRYTSIYDGSTTRNVRTSDARIAGAFIPNITNNSTTSSDGEGSFTYNFPDFDYPPIVTATPVLTESGATEAGKNISVVLKTVTNNRVEGIVKFNTTGVASVGVNLLIVGIPV
jgi:hypothetical protein